MSFFPYGYFVPFDSGIFACSIKNIYWHGRCGVVFNDPYDAISIPDPNNVFK